MHNFIADLTEDEKTLLSHVTMQYMDRLYDEHSKDRGSPRDWDRGQERVSYEVTVQGVPLTVQGFAKNHPEFYDGSWRKDEPMASETLSFMGSISHYSPKNEFRQKYEMYSHPAFGAMSVGRHHGSFSLFDHPVEEQHAISLSVLDANMYAPREWDPDPTISVSGGMGLVEIKLSDSQYVRMIRGEFMEVPCTISRSFGYLHDEPDNRFMEPVKLRKDVESKVDQIIGGIEKDINALYDALAEGKLTSKKKLAALIDLVEEIEQQWTPIYEEINAFRGESIDRVRQVFIDRLADQVNADIKRMPASDQQLLLEMLGDL